MKLKHSSLLVTSAVAAMTLSGAVQAAILAENQTVNKSHNLYYTGMAPLDRVGTLVRYPTDLVEVTGTAYYNGHLTALRDYPSSLLADTAPSVRPTGCPDPDTNRECFGVPGKVIDLAASVDAAETTVYVSVTGTVSSDNAAGTGTEHDYNALSSHGLVAVWAKEDTTTNVTNPLPLTNLQNYKDNVNFTANVEHPTDGKIGTAGDPVDQGTGALHFLNEHPGFTQIGEEFLVVGTAVPSGSTFTGVQVTRPADATHLVLGYNGVRGEFTTASTDEFSVSVYSTDPSGTPAVPVASVAVSGGTLTNDAVSVTVGTSLTFTGSAVYDNTSHSGYAWTLDTASVGTDSDTYTNTFTTAGTFTVGFTATDSASASGSKNVTVNVAADNVAPVAGFTASNNNKVVTFTSSSTDADAGDTLTYAWDFGDSLTSTEQNPVHTYAADGTYTVTLTVNDGTVDSTASTQDVVVKTTEVEPTSGGGAMFGMFGLLALFAPSLVRRRMK